jgi:hypothetical protein
MPTDFLDYLDPVAADAYRRAAYQRQQVGDPNNTGTGQSPEEQTDFLSRMLDQSLGGVSYLGKLVDKPARSVRAGLNLLAGGSTPASELLSFLPGSDTIGLTQERNAVQGSDINASLGITTRGDDSLENQAAGFLTELATDPLTYAGIGPLTQGGKAAARAGTLAPKLSQRIAQGQAGLMDFGIPLQETLFGAPRKIVGTGATGQAIAENFWKPVTYPATQAALGAEKYIGGPIQRAIGTNPVTALGNLGDKAYLGMRQLFDTRVAEAGGRVGQTLAENQFTPLLKQGRADAEARFASALTPLDDYAKQIPVDKRLDFGTALTQHAEGYTQDAQGKLLGLGFNQQDVQDILAIGDRVATETRATLGAERAAGVVSKEATDTPQWALLANKQAKAAGLAEPFPAGVFPTDYFPRTALNPEGDVGRAISTRLSGSSQFQEARAPMFRGIPGGTAGIEGLIKDPTMAGAGRTAFKSDLQVQSDIVQSLTGRSAAQGMPAAWVGTPWGDAAWKGANKQAKKLADYLKAVPDKTRQEGLFNFDFLGNARARQLESARTVASGETMITGLTQQAVPLTQLQQAGVRAVPLKEALEKAGMTQKVGGRMPVSYQRIAAGLGVNPNQLKDLAIPEDVAKDLFRIGQAWTTPESLKPVVDMWDRFASLFKGGVTSPFPAFHVRNLMTGVFNMSRAGVLSKQAGEDMFRVLRGGSLSDETITKLFPGQTAEEATKKFRELLIANNVAFTRSGQVGERIGGIEAVSRPGLLPGSLPDVGAAQPRPLKQDLATFGAGFIPEKGKVFQQLNPLESLARPVGSGSRSEFLPFKQGEKMGNTAEDWIRGTHFLGAMLHDMGPAEAKLTTMKYQIDYADMTQFEKNIMKRVFPWYAFSRKNLPPILEDLVTQPGQISAATRLVGGVRDPGQFVPSFVGEGASVPIPGAPEGQQRYISSFGLPIEDEALKTIGSFLKGDVQRTFQQGIGQANPLFKLPFEQAFGTQLYSGRKLEDLQPSTVLGLGGLVPDDIARGATELASNSPAARALHTVDTLFDPRKSIGSTLFNLGTGVRVTDIDTARQQDLAARQLVKDELRGNTGIKSREEVYAPLKTRGELDPTTRYLLDLLKETDKRVQDRAKLEQQTAR